MFLLTTIVCLVVSLWSASKELQQARTDLEVAEARIHDYRSELGYLNIVDPSKLHFVRVPLPGDLKWQWRFYVPEENRFMLSSARRLIPKDGISKVSDGGTPLPAREVTVHASIYQDINGQRKFRLDVQGHVTAINSMEGPDTTWLDRGIGGLTYTAGSEGTEAAKTGETAVLLRLRAYEEIKKVDEEGKISTEMRLPDEPGQGLMIWIIDSKKSDQEPGAGVSDAEATDSPTK